MKPLHPTHAALLAGCAAAPADDTPRLVLADWLDEHAALEGCGVCGGTGVGSPLVRGWRADPAEWRFKATPPCYECRGAGRVSDGRAELAEFIRVQCELFHKPCPAFLYSCHESGEAACRCRDYGHYDALRERERELLRDNWDAWSRVVNETDVGDRAAVYCANFGDAPAGARWVYGVRYRRGFVAEARGRLQDLLAHLPALGPTLPLVERADASDDDLVYELPGFAPLKRYGVHSRYRALLGHPLELRHNPGTRLGFPHLSERAARDAASAATLRRCRELAAAAP